MRQNRHRAHEANLFELADSVYSLFILDAPSICCFFFKIVDVLGSMQPPSGRLR